ncbi:MAG: hypothetical protein ACXVIB_06620 [Halobacteriota archaeon]
MPTADSDPWLRLPEESARAYEAFRRYREMGPKRSIAKVARALGCSKRPLESWSSAHRWVVRAACYDNHLDLKQQKRYEHTMLEAAAERAKQARAVEQRAIERLAKVDFNQLSISELLRIIDVATELEMKAYTYYEMW